MNSKQMAIIFIHAFVGWALCGATMGIVMGVTSLGNALIVHAILAPVFFILVSINYFSKFNSTAPLQTALIFVGFVIFVDFFFMALLINKSLDMFASLLGTWIPFVLIFFSSYVTGLIITKTYQATRNKKL